MDRLRRRLTKKRRSSCGSSIVKAVVDDTTSSSTQHCSPEIVSVSVTSAAMSVDYGQRDSNSSTTQQVTANSKAFETASEAITPTTAATTPTAASSADAKRLLKQQYDIVRSNLISTPSDEDVKAPLASQKETEDMSSLPSNTHSAVNCFEPSFAEFEIVQSPKIPSPFKLSTPEYRKKGKILSKRSISVLSEINISTTDYVSEIGTPEGLNNEDENLVCLQVFNETLTRGGGHCASNRNVDNDIVSLPQLSVVTPEDDQQCRRKTMNDSPYQTTTKTSSYNYCTDEDVQKLCNDMIQALSKGCGLNDTYDSSILDEIKNSLWSE